VRFSFADGPALVKFKRKMLWPRHWDVGRRRTGDVRMDLK
jgi:hypothetical protein